MILLDTDHLTVLKYPGYPRCANLTARMEASSGQIFATTIINSEEQMRGWLAKINRIHDVHQQTQVYEELLRLFEFFKDWQILPFDVRAADEFKRLRKLKIRLGSMDLKIASITRAHDALLLSANLRDFRQVPGLNVESWLD